MITWKSSKNNQIKILGKVKMKIILSHMTLKIITLSDLNSLIILDFSLQTCSLTLSAI